MCVKFWSEFARCVREEVTQFAESFNMVTSRPGMQTLQGVSRMRGEASEKSVGGPEALTSLRGEPSDDNSIVVRLQRCVLSILSLLELYLLYRYSCINSSLYRYVELHIILIP